jgi:hypothetical protein
MKEKELLFGAKVAMVSLLGLFLELLPLLQLSFVREGDAIDTLERVVSHLPKPVR